MVFVRGTLRMVCDLFAYVARSGQWWFVLLIVALFAVSALIGAAHAAVPTIVYALF